MGALKVGAVTRAPGAAEGEALLSRYDWQNDAFGDFPLVPCPAAAEFLMAWGLRTGAPLALKAALRSLSVLPKSDLHDPVDGGFFERCAQAGWKDPTTRKTLAQNAALLQAFATAAAWTGDAALKDAAASTAAYMDGHLKAKEGDLWATSEGPDDEYYAKMGTARSKAPPPPRGGPADTASNAAAVSAFVRAGLALNEPRWLGRARLAGRTLLEGPKPTSAYPTAAAATAALDLWAGTGEREWLGKAEALMREAVHQIAERSGPPGSLRHFAAAQALTLLAFARWSEGQEEGALESVRAAVARTDEQEGDLDAIAALGMARLAAAFPTIVVRCRGTRVDAPDARAVRAGLAAAWAVGPPRLAMDDWPGPGASRAGVSFRVPGRVTSWTTDPEAVRELLRSAVDFKEGL